MQWKAMQVTSEMVINRNIRIKNGSKELWGYIENMIEDAVQKGYLVR